jgi:hypothetical protein
MGTTSDGFAFFINGIEKNILGLNAKKFKKFIDFFKNIEFLCLGA